MISTWNYYNEWVSPLIRYKDWNDIMRIKNGLIPLIRYNDYYME